MDYIALVKPGNEKAPDNGTFNRNQCHCML